MTDAHDHGNEFTDRDYEDRLNRDHLDDTHMPYDTRQRLWEQYRREWESERRGRA